MFRTLIIFALVSLLPCAVFAQTPPDAENGPVAAEDVPAAPAIPAIDMRALAHLPSLAPVVTAMSSAGLQQAKGEIQLDHDVEGRVSDARLQVSTGHRRVDAAFLKWARQIRFAPGSAGTVRVPLAMSGGPVR